VWAANWQSLVKDLPMPLSRNSAGWSFAWDHDKHSWTCAVQKLRSFENTEMWMEPKNKRFLQKETVWSSHRTVMAMAMDRSHLTELSVINILQLRHPHFTTVSGVLLPHLWQTTADIGRPEVGWVSHRSLTWRAAGNRPLWCWTESGRLQVIEGSGKNGG